MRAYICFGFLAISLNAFLSGCSGKLVIDEDALDTQLDPNSCIAVTCNEGFECVAGECVALALCNPLNPNGYCGPGAICVDGVCVPEQSGLSGCGDDNLLCAPNEACIEGVCTAIEANQACSLTKIDGLCPWGQECVQGWCYWSEGIACSATQLDGVCPPGSRCTGGDCLEDAGTCSEVIQDGTCDSWQECVRGQCAGPIALDACSPMAPNGRCPATEVCVGGTCTELYPGNICSLQNPNGLCPAGAGCSAGQCRVVDSTNECSNSNLTGLCLGGAQCRDGACAQIQCGAGGLLCSPGHYCTDTGECAPLSCDPVHPNGECIDTTLACTRGLCLPPDCSGDNPEGFCPPGLVCRSGECGVPVCSDLYPFGECPDGEVCNSGICVPRPCSVELLGGVCNETVAFCHPEVGCNNFLEATCCDQTLVEATGCQLGTCSAPPCSIEEPYGACLDDYVCMEGVCALAPCSPFYPDGFCEVEGEECIAGRCARTGCAGQAEPDAFCTPDICDTNLDICVTPPCSISHLDGFCPVGTVCCNTTYANEQGCASGQCFEPNCSAGFPGGNCSADEVCIGGVCILAPCGQDFPNGACGVNYTCNAGECVRAPCTIDAPQGYCPQGQRCIDGGCILFECSEQFPQGSCPPGQFCDDSSGTPLCVTPECSPQNPGGSCPGNQVCSNGACVFPGCSALVPDGQCPANQYCDAGECRLKPCAPDVLDGECNSGEVCCDNELVSTGFCSGNELGNCKETECSLAFPYGKCASEAQVCVTQGDGAECVDLCSSTALSGWCPELFACVEGACSLACPEDFDCDGIPNSTEAGVDTDLDGVDDDRDRDSDGDSILDALELTDDVDSDGKPNYRDRDADGDYLLDRLEVGAVPKSPLDFDFDEIPDFLDVDSDNDGILDRCEGALSGCSNTTLLSSAADTDDDSVPDFHDLDSDADGIPDAIEARAIPAEASSVVETGANHDGDFIPDYRDLDSDNDGVNDADEDVDGDGIVNCQVDGAGEEVRDTRLNPSCGQISTPFSNSEPYNFNPGCPNAKCVLAESSRVHPDTDGDGIGDGQDGVFQVCSSGNLKPINLFYSRFADFALALEEDFNTTNVIYRGIANPENEAGLTFDASNTSNTPNIPNTISGAHAVSGFILNKTPSVEAMAVTSIDPQRSLIEKALAQASVDTALIESISVVNSVSLIINRNFSSFDNYGVVLSRFEIRTEENANMRALRNDLVEGLDSSLTELTESEGPRSDEFILQMETLYRYDNGTTGTVLVIGAISPKGSSVNDDASYSYRTQCSKQTDSSTCNSRDGCQWQSGACVKDFNYQIPLFFVDNITNGSAVAQYGDDIAALCQSMIQDYAKVDFLWVVDNSGSMEDEISQVLNSAQLFFELMNQTEADYRVGQTSTMTTAPRWPPRVEFKNPQGDESLLDDMYTQGICNNYSEWNCSDYYCKWDSSASQCIPDGSFSVNGFLRGGFTGAIAGKTSDDVTDRDFAFDCSAHPSNCTTSSCGGSACCSACDGEASGSIINEPSCYFASKLPCASGSGAEYGLTMGQWAVFRSGATSGCTGLGTNQCNAAAGCQWRNNGCYQDYCSNETNSMDCDGIAHCLRVGQVGSAGCNADPECTWVNGECQLDVCSNLVGESTCENDPRCAWDGVSCKEHIGWYCAALDVTDCTNDSRCSWLGAAYQCASNHCAGKGDAVECTNSDKCSVSAGECIDRFESTIAGNCEWDPFTKLCLPTLAGAMCRTFNVAQCALVESCFWDGVFCRSQEPSLGTLCDATSDAVCENMGGSIRGEDFCQWTDSDSSCQATPKYAFRKDAAKVAVMLSDEEACSLRDGPNASGFFANDGWCTWYGDYGVGLTPYDSGIRAARTQSFTDFYRARGFTVFAITGDKPELGREPGGNNGGCDANGNQAEAGQGYIAVAEGTGGGWGSICAADLYPSIESIVISSIAKGSSYKLESTIDGRSVQPIASTIQVATEVCDVPTEYPNCGSGTHTEVIPRSRDNGYDYDALNNTLVLYGDARPKEDGDITVSYRYWVDLSQPAIGNPACPCPETIAEECVCAAGRACGASDTPSTNRCEGLMESACAQTPGCQYNSVAGCLVNGICEPDPTCGGSCPFGEVCNPLTGLCMCDQTCGGQCGVGLRCDYDEASPTCGDCLCDTTCAGGCPAGQVCDDDINSGTCGQCSCDTTCAGACTGDLLCNDDIGSPSCGFCEPPQCGNCPAGTQCDRSTGLCICDFDCGGGCPLGQSCDDDSESETCGQCLCDPTCGGSCPNGTICNGNTGSPSCGRCLVDPTCGGNCSEGEVCNPVTGLCEPTCPECGIGQVCNTITAQCVCDQGCGGACPEGSFCDSDLASPTCGTCVCDATCGGGDCPAGQICDDGTRCSGLASEQACLEDLQCVVDSETSECFSPTCGRCSVDPTCGGDCPTGTVCDPLSGLCIADPECGGCPPNFQCNPLTGQCDPVGG